MNKAKVLLIYPNQDTVPRVPTALAILSAKLIEKGHDVKVFDLSFLGDKFITDFDYLEDKGLAKKSSFSEAMGSMDNRPLDIIFKEQIRGFPPDLVGITLLQRNYANTLKCIKLVRDELGDVPIAAGGIMPTIAPDIVINTEGIDMINIGEGEESIVELAEASVNGRAFSEIQNVWLKTDNGIKKNPLRPLINMDDSPAYNWELFDERHLIRPYEGKIYRFGSFEFGRGCTKKCTFCAAPYLKKAADGLGKYLRYKSIEQLVREMREKVDQYNLELIQFCDADFMQGLRVDTLREFMTLYKQEIGLPFLFQNGPETLNEDRIKILADAGCVTITIGVESGSDRIRRHVIKKPISRERILRGFDLLRKYKIRSGANYIIGVPDETEEDVWETIHLNREIDPASIAANYFVPFIGTELYDVCQQRGYIDSFDSDWNMYKDNSLDMPQLSEKRINELVNILIEDFSETHIPYEYQTPEQVLEMRKVS